MNGRFWTLVGRCSIQLDAEGMRMDEVFGRQSAVAEARALYRKIGDEHTVEEIGDRAGASRLRSSLSRGIVFR